MFSILFAEDDDQLRKTIVDYLSAKNLEILPARNGSEAVDRFYDNDPDLIILDIMMPIMNGMEVCKIIRRRNKTVPILFLTAMAQERDYLDGFKCGCDDYIVKPFPLSVLHEKCMNLIKRSKRIDSDNSLTVSGIRLDFNTYKVYIDNNEIPLSGKDFNLLWYLMENKNIVLNRELILTHLWGYDFDGDTRVVDTHIKNLRKALGEKSSLIRTVVNIGYSFQEV